MANAGNIITYSALSRKEIELLYHAAAGTQVVRFLTGYEVSVEGLLPGSSVADMRQGLVQAKPPAIGYKYQLFCNDRIVSDDDLLDGTVVYGATIVPSELQFSKVVKQKVDPPAVGVFLGLIYQTMMQSSWRCKVTVQPLPPDIVGEHGLLRPDAAATLADGGLENPERGWAWLTSPDLGWASADRGWWGRLRRDHYWGQTLASGSTSDQNALNSLFEQQAAQTASHADSPCNIVIVSAGYVLTASRTRKTLFDNDPVDFTGYTYNPGYTHKVVVPEPSSDRLEDHRFMQRRLQFQTRPISPASAPKRHPNISGAKLPRSKSQQSWGRSGRK